MPRSRCVPRREEGFTILEMMIALIILGTLFAVSAVAYSTIQRKQEIADNGGCIRSHDVTTYLMSGDVMMPKKETICDEWQSPQNIDNPKKLR